MRNKKVPSMLENKIEIDEFSQYEIYDNFLSLLGYCNF